MTKNKYEIAEYLANLMSIDAYHDDLGITSKWLHGEMLAMTKALGGIIEQEKEKENEAGTRQYIPRGTEAGAHPTQGQSGRSEPTRNGNGNKTELGKGIRRPGP